MDIGTLNYLSAQALIAGFVAAGIDEAVISPGSRSTPLTLALLRTPGIRCTLAIDERSAAFFALGLGKASRRPALLVATSGTAPANWLPAVIEASQADIPLLLLSADRPPEIQGWGANQTVAQSALFSDFVRARHALPAPRLALDQAFSPEGLWRVAARAVEESSWPQAGPVHLNLPFHEPLIPAGATPAWLPAPVLSLSQPPALPQTEAIRRLATQISGRPGAIVCGELPARSAAEKNALFAALTVLAARLGCPLLLEPLSGLRFGRHWQTPAAAGARTCVRYADWLKQPQVQAALDATPPEWVLRIGPWPVTRPLQNFVASARWQALIDPAPAWRDPQQRLDLLLHASPLAACEALLQQDLQPATPAWSAAFAAWEAAAAAEVETEPTAVPPSLHPASAAATLDNRPGSGRCAARRIAAILAGVPDDTACFIGNSLAIRELDSHSGCGPAALDFFGNRGASGIDGNISSAAGIAAIRGRALALLGDLTTQHDLGGLALAQGRNLVIVTVNNGGGGIFDYLPQASLPEFVAGWRTPQQIDFAAAAATFGLAYRRIETPQALTTAIREAFATGGPHLLETC
ncbi:2-succinyl-5-enolpyruvyl-6-hydroxy-3-cyclohexene-1-carboxylic-acid synthase [Dechloromonas sp. ZY10]|uniref:2-succinyl-5-enolpyruvyl-6-hydroxy-3- cyclohexene-1-carboxylic-acid synthase n=1 Tax=Dechloromonas aquae TaxID=2664436 RepID=UPI0035276DB8